MSSENVKVDKDLFSSTVNAEESKDMIRIAEIEAAKRYPKEEERINPEPVFIKKEKVNTGGKPTKKKMDFLDLRGRDRDVFCRKYAEKNKKNFLGFTKGGEPVFK